MSAYQRAQEYVKEATSDVEKAKKDQLVYKSNHDESKTENDAA